MGEIDVGAGARGRVVRRARELRAPWGRRSREEGWNPAEDWWTPSVDAVCEAHACGGDLTGACTRLGEARARSGVGIGRALTDLDAFARVAGWDPVPFHLVLALAEGWVEGGRGRNTCQDPLTGLAGEEYLRTRVGELYRGANETAPAAFGHQLVVVALDPSLDPWRRTARMIVLGHELRRFFTRGESVCLVSRGRIAVVTRDGPGLTAELDELREGICWDHGAAVWSVPMPGTHREAASLLDGLGRPRRGE
ncbi:hypothetical protein ACWFMI_09795 [Nocardiopsis terrae]